VAEFAQSLVNQYTWGYRSPVPYVSVFSDWAHAGAWALAYSRDKGVDCTVYTIDGRFLRNTFVFKVSVLEQELSVQIPEEASQHRGAGYLCLHSVPASAISDSENITPIDNMRAVKGTSKLT